VSCCNGQVGLKPYLKFHDATKEKLTLAETLTNYFICFLSMPTSTCQMIRKANGTQPTESLKKRLSAAESCNRSQVAEYSDTFQTRKTPRKRRPTDAETNRMLTLQRQQQGERVVCTQQDELRSVVFLTERDCCCKQTSPKHRMKSMAPEWMPCAPPLPLLLASTYVAKRLATTTITIFCGRILARFGIRSVR
jgi:hypothetical protein